MSPAGRSCKLALAALLAIAAAAGAGLGDPTEYRVEWSWSQWGLEPGLGDFVAVNLDVDPQPELLVTAEIEDPPGDILDGRWYIVDFAGGTFLQVWSSFAYPVPVRELATACAGEACEIVVGTDLGLDVFDGARRELLRSLALPMQLVGGLEVAELDGDPSRELVACDRDNLYLLDFDSLTLLATRYGFGCTDLAVAELDGDPAPELALAGNSFGLLVVDGESLEIEWTDAGAQGDKVEAADLDLDGVSDLVYQLQRQQGVRARSLVTGALLWQRPTDYFRALAIGDLDPTPGVEVVLGDWDGGGPAVLSGGTGALLWSAPWDSVSGWAALVADLDGDGAPELVVPEESPPRMVAVDPLTHDVAVESPTYWPADFRAGDADADGVNEIVAMMLYTNGGPHFVAFDAAFRAIEYEGPPVGSEWAGAGRVALGQFDQDAQLELCTQIGIGSDLVTLHCQDGLDHLLHWTVDLPSNSYPTGLAAVDLDGDGGCDLVSGTEDAALLGFDGPTGAARWSAPTTVQSSFDRIVRGDVDGDGDGELVAGGPQVQWPYSAELAVFDTLLGALEYGPFGGDFESFALADLDGTPPAELLVLSRTGELGVLDPVNGALSPPLATFPDESRALAVADLTRDGVLDYAVVAAGHLHIHDGALGSTVWTSPYVLSDAGDNDSLSAGDVDQDGVPDLLLGTRIGFFLIEAPLLTVFADGFESGDTSAWTITLP